MRVNLLVSAQGKKEKKGKKRNFVDSCVLICLCLHRGRRRKRAKRGILWTHAYSFACVCTGEEGEKGQEEEFCGLMRINLLVSAQGKKEKKGKKRNFVDSCVLICSCLHRGRRRKRARRGILWTHAY